MLTSKTPPPPHQPPSSPALEGPQTAAPAGCCWPTGTPRPSPRLAQAAPNDRPPWSRGLVGRTFAHMARFVCGGKDSGPEPGEGQDISHGQDKLGPDVARTEPVEVPGGPAVPEATQCGPEVRGLGTPRFADPGAGAQRTSALLTRPRRPSSPSLHRTHAGFQAAAGPARTVQAASQEDKGGARRRPASPCPVSGHAGCSQAPGDETRGHRGPVPEPTGTLDPAARGRDRGTRRGKPHAHGNGPLSQPP